MSHSRSKGSRHQLDRFSQNRDPQAYGVEHSRPEYNRDLENSRERFFRPQNSNRQYSEEQEPQGAQGGYESQYGGSPGIYGRRSGYSQNNFVPGSHEESDFSFGSEYIRDERADRPSRMSRQTGNRSWIGLGDSSYSGDQGGRAYSSDEYNENPSYMDERSEREYGNIPSDVSRSDYRRLERLGAFGNSGSGQNYGQSSQYRQSFAGRGPQGYTRSDERILEDINEHLTVDNEVDASNIHVECREGEVTLKGTVTDRWSKRRAEDIADSCSGVKDVQNQLRIQQENASGFSDEGKKSEEKQSKAS
jgi:osmotically-inducible protein OsmY